MYGENVYQLVLRSKIFQIPNDFQFLEDVDLNIYSILKTTKRYEVKSNVSENVFQYFINHWVDMKTPCINLDNISEYEQLSKEFNRMTNLVQIFKQNMPKLYSSFLIGEKESLEKKIKINNNLIQTKCEKYQRIANILFESGKFIKQSVLSEIRKDLINACYSKNMKFVNLLTQKVVKLNGLLYVINEENRTAYVLKNIDAKDDIFIPRSISIDSKDFIITSIIENAFKNSKIFRTIQFPQNSEIQLIDKSAFFNSSLESITIPPKVTEIGECAFYLCKQLKKIEFPQNSELNTINIHAFFKCPLKFLSIPSNIFNLNDGWCNGLYLNDFSINENNHYFMNYENNYILGKTDFKSEVFDVLLFSQRNIEKAKIPPFIKKISPFAFKECNNLKEVSFSNNSELKIIGNNSFSFSSIEYILIPSNVTHICEDAFSFCRNLKKIDFADNSKLQIIDKNAFTDTQISSIEIPKNVIMIMSNCFFNCSKLQKVDFPPDSILKFIGEYAFSRSPITTISIPQYVSKIAKSAFADCMKLESVNFNNDSRLELIEECAFNNSSINIISIPDNVIKIENSAFSNCRNLKKVEITKNSELRLIEKSAFSTTLIEYFYIPQNVAFIGENSFLNCWNLSTIENDSKYELNLDEKKGFELSITKVITKNQKK